jgi:hypothetical protein
MFIKMMFATADIQFQVRPSISIKSYTKLISGGNIRRIKYLLTKE